MRFKIDKNLNIVAAAKVAPVDLETVAVELCARFIEAEMIDDDHENWGKIILGPIGPQRVIDVFAILADYLYNDKDHSVPADVFRAFCALTIIGDGDCPYCGGDLKFEGTEGHELNDGDYYTPNTYEIDYYIYHCAVCGETIKSKIEL